MEHKAQAETRPKFHLPPSLISPADMRRLVREIAVIDETLLQLGLRASGTTVKMPKTSRLMEQVVELNKLNLLKAPDRAELKQDLSLAQAGAPVIHMSFSAEPSPVFTEKLMAWLRREIHPQVLLDIGLQPSLGAGCVLRTPNKYFDLSLRQSLEKQRGLLISKLTGEARVPVSTQAPVPTPVSTEAA